MTQTHDYEQRAVTKHGEYAGAEPVNLPKRISSADYTANAGLCAANVLNCGNEAVMNTSKITILYERLSVEDERDGESNSIIGQRNLLEQYAERSGFMPYIHIADDGLWLSA